jgi:acetyltransferase-like isoleucine patch superfamily enzyme
LKDVEHGKGCVIAAGAVVTDDVKPYDIVGGIPARKISEGI